MIGIIWTICILAIITCVAVPVVLAFTTATYNNNHHTKRTFKKTIISSIISGILFFPLVFATILGPAGLYTVQSGEVAVVRTFGQVTSMANPGMNYRNPLTEKVEKYNMKSQWLEFDYETYTKEDLGVTVTIQIQWAYNKDNIELYAKSHQRNAANGWLLRSTEAAIDASSQTLAIDNYTANLQSSVRSAVILALRDDADLLFICVFILSISS